MSRESERITVVELHKTGMRTADIVRTTGFKQRTVYKIVRRYKETGGTSDRPRSGRPTTATTPENINKPVHNHQNRRQLLKKGQQKTSAARTISRRHFPASVMVWAGICATGKTPLVFMEQNVKINAASYQQYVLRDVLEPWATSHFGETGFSLQQDWAPAHSAKSTIAVCEELFPGFWSRDIWPSNSPDLNPMDYSVWSIMEQKISTTRYATVEQLKSALLRSWDEITAEQCATIISDFPKRLRKCIEAREGNFEHLL
ncbi:unnamed protein product [Heligmosomoides polygyrus]|uniref:DDE_3 domain-containing protein n=1 Tax=Heligmosomoides polygyrus TaxID=6339 RepID=A0A183FT12_HELPZ|nr:unnamed protein product [Heligmosomoides polygyrus]